MPPQKGKSEKEKNQHIQVAVRCRPLNGNEKRHGSYSVVEACSEKREVNVRERAIPTAPVKTFTFDKVFGINSKQIEVYKSIVSPIIDEVVQGYNCTVFAYGQTGTGKTFTMEGEKTDSPDFTWEDDPLSGIIPRAMCHLFSRLQKQNCEFSVRVSFLEIYNEELIDLLGAESVENPRLKIYEDATRKGSHVIQGLEEVVVHSKDEVYHIMERGSQRRQTAATLMNAHSSRSHSVFMVTVHIKENSIDGEELLKTGKLNLVDLAGSECIGRSGAVDRRAREAGQINQSLLTLGRVITALVEHAPHVPYRESKLTRLLQDSLGGRTKTSIIATISPAACNLEETLSTLDYAHRAKNITNRPEVNQKLTKKALLREYTEEIERIRRDLQAARDKNGIFLAQENYDAMQTEILQQKDSLQNLTEQLEVVNLELIKTSELFSCTKEELALTQVELKECSDDLNTTKELLQKTETSLRHTRQDRDEQRHLVGKHVKSEAMLHAQATQLLSTVDSATADVDGLHAKLDRKRQVEEQNTSAQEQFQNHFRGSVDTMKTSLNNFTEGQMEFNSLLSTNMGNLLEKRSGEVVEMCADLNTLVGIVRDQAHTVRDTQDEHSSTAQGQLEAIHTYAQTIEEKEVSRQSTFHEKTFVAAVSLIQEMLQRHNSALEQLSQFLHQKVTEQQALAAQFAAEQLTQLEQQRSLVDDFTTQEMQRLSQHREHTETMMAAQNTLSNSLVEQLLANVGDLVRQMAAKEKTQREEHSTKLLSSLNATKGATEEFKTTALSQVSELTHHNKKSEEQLKTATSQHNQEAEARIQELQSEVNSLQEKSSTLTTDVTSFTQETKSNVHSEMKELIERVQAHSQNLKEAQAQHTQGIESLVSQCSQKGKSMEERETTQQSELTATIQSEQTSLDDNCKGVTDWSSAMTTALEGSMGAIDHFLSDDLAKDIPTGLTPKPRNFTYPRSLKRTGRHSLLLEDFRKDYVMNEALNCPVPDDSFESLMSQAAADADAEELVNGSCSEHSTSFDSAISSSLSTTEQVQQENKENLTMPPPTRRPSNRSNNTTARSRSNSRSGGNHSRTNSQAKDKTPVKTPTKTPGKSKITTSKPVNTSSGKSRLPLKMSNP